MEEEKNVLNSNMKICKKCGTHIDKKVKHCPQCGARCSFPVWVIILIVIVSAGLLGVLFGEEDSEKNSSPKKANEKIEYVKVTKDELDEALKNNAAVAKDTYNKKYVEISGRLGTIDSDLEYISLVSSTNKWDIIGVHCALKNKEQRNVVKTLSKDQEIIVRGKITDVGEVLGYFLDVIEIKSNE